MSLIKNRQDRQEHTKKIIDFNKKVYQHIFAFELKDPSFKTLHDAVHEDGEFYRLAVGLGPVYVERYFNLMQEKIGAQTQAEKDTILQQVQREILLETEAQAGEFNDFCQRVNTFDAKYHLSNNAIHYLKQKSKHHDLEKVMQDNGLPYRLYYRIKTKV